jgi:hypothetical protein
MRTCVPFNRGHVVTTGDRREAERVGKFQNAKKKEEMEPSRKKAVEVGKNRRRTDEEKGI